MAILQVREVDDRLYIQLKDRAKRENRSLSQEVISILEKYLSNPRQFNTEPTREFLSLSGSWDDERGAQEIVEDIRAHRKNSKKFGDTNVVFN